MNEAILAQLGNTPDLGSGEAFTAIVGERPSQGARSPALWNAVFEAKVMPVRFHPFDVRGKCLAPLIDVLRTDRRFAGGAVTMPHKAAIIEHLDQVEAVAGRIGAVNAVYRDGDALVGSNTDGAAALAVLRAKLGVEHLASGKVLILGAGGAGAAVACYLADELERPGSVVLSNRARNKAETLAARVGPAAVTVPWPPRREDLSGVEILINATSLGYAPGPEEPLQRNRFMTALSAAADPVANIRESVAAIKALRPDCLVFDVVYQPRDTLLLSLAEGLGLPTLGGIGMNLEQAVIAFAKVVPDVSPADIRQIMQAVP